MDPYVTSTPNSIKLPILDTGKFEQWKFIIQQYLQHEHYALWEVIEFGDSYRAHAQDKSIPSEATPSSRSKGKTEAVTTEDMQKRRNDFKARTTLLLALPDEHQLRFSNGKSEVPTAQSFSTASGQVTTASTELPLLPLAMILSVLEEDGILLESVRATKESGQSKRELTRRSRAKVDEKELEHKAMMAIDGIGWDWSFMAEENKASENQALVAEENQPRGTKELEQSKNPNSGKELVMQNKACYKCGSFEHLKVNCNKNKWVNKGKNWSRVNYTQGNLTPKAILLKSGTKTIAPNRSFSTARTSLNVAQPKMKSFVKSAHSNVKRPFERKSIAKNKIWVPTVRTKNPTVGLKVPTAKPTVAAAKGNKGKAVKASARWIWKPKQISGEGSNVNGVSVTFKKYQYIDTQGRLKSVMAWLSKRTNSLYLCQRYVSFGYGGGKITGKGTIKTGKLEFENVHFVKELKYNLFSVSQICDNKNCVLFTDSECIVLGRDFKLEDDRHVLLRTPRQQNMYAVDLKDIVPHKNLTCLIAKASVNESMLWHRRLGHLNFKTMNKLVRNNLVIGTSSSNISGTKEDVKQAEKEKGSPLRFIALLNWFHEAQMVTTNDAAKKSGGILIDSPQKEQEEVHTDKDVSEQVEHEVNEEVPESSGICFPTTSSKESSKFTSTLTVETAVPTISTYVPTASENIITIDPSKPPSTLTVETTVPTVSTPIPTKLCIEELLHLSDSEVWFRCDCPKGVRPIGTKMGFLKQQKYERGIVIRNKARLVAQGHTQEEDIDYKEFFAPVARIEAFRRSSNPKLCREFEALMHDKFKMSVMGELSFFLGLQVLQKKDGIFLSQDKYSCARHQVTPKECHLHAVKRIFRYLKGHPKLGLWYPKESPFDLVAYSDSDYGGASQDRKSTTGGCQFLGRRLISWQCKKQTIVATSTTEAEYVAAASGCGQVLWIQNQLLDYGYNFMNTKIYIDNNSAICIVKNPVFHSRTKHIEIRHHFIRDCFEKKLIYVDHIHTDDNVADLLTKAFDVGRFQYLVCLSPKRTSFIEFSSNIATALVCLATNRTYNFSKMRFVYYEESITRASEKESTLNFLSLPEIQHLIQEDQELQERELQEEFVHKDQSIREHNERDAEIARIHAEEDLRQMINELDRSNVMINKHMAEYEEAKNDLSIEEKTELITELINYQKDFARIKKYQAQQQRGMTFDQLEEKFIPVWKSIQDFVPMDSKKESESQEEETSVNYSYQLSRTPFDIGKIYMDKLREVYQIFRVGQAPKVYPYFESMLKNFDRDDLVTLWKLVQDRSVLFEPVSTDLLGQFEAPIKIKDSTLKKMLDHKCEGERARVATLIINSIENSNLADGGFLSFPLPAIIVKLKEHLTSFVENTNVTSHYTQPPCDARHTNLPTKTSKLPSSIRSKSI
ncbi:putative ribonuclease H-like domain-containing protein [Tanacetum coccineum]|uniref:Ribonuclease H-like domain-containing protein n=1 Tax=Tanacetum coccineum TaxID=301880 RepID=A0ABQ5B709_9ASTR